MVLKIVVNDSFLLGKKKVLFSFIRHKNVVCISFQVYILHRDEIVQHFIPAIYSLRRLRIHAKSAQISVLETKIKWVYLNKNKQPKTIASTGRPHCWLTESGDTK